MSFVLWLTGLPSAGKSTLARLLEEALRDRQMSVEVLDGDERERNGKIVMIPWCIRANGSGGPSINTLL